MLKKLMITTALTGLMIGAAAAEGTPPAASPASPPAATSPMKDQSATPATKDESATKNQAATTTGSAASVQVINQQKPDQWLASKFKGTDVIGNDNEKIGDVSDLLFDKSGKVEAFIVGVGGFLGIGSKDVAIPPSSFQVVAGDKSKNESDKLKLSMTKDQLKQAANFEPYNPPRATTGAGAGAGSGGMTRPAPAPAPAPSGR